MKVCAGFQAQRGDQLSSNSAKFRNQRQGDVQARRFTAVFSMQLASSQPFLPSPPTSGRIHISGSRFRHIVRPVCSGVIRALQPARVAKLRELLSGPNILKAWPAMHDQHAHSFSPNLAPMKHIIARCTTNIPDNIHMMQRKCLY